MSRRTRRDRPKKKLRQNVIKDYTNNVPNLNKTLNQFICEDCYCVSLVAEDISHGTKKYTEKELLCSCCDRKTLQICVKDTSFTQRILEMTQERTKKEDKAFQIIKKSRSRNKK